MNNLENWNKVSTPPIEALKKITGGRISGMTDINPQWRYEVMTETYGPCGIGWKFKVVKKWTEPATDGQIFAFVDVELFIKVDSEWSEAIPGTGGNMLVTKETKGLHSSDEAYKMATTDALSTAMKMIGVAASIYLGSWDGSKYQQRQQQSNQQAPKKDQNLEKLLSTLKVNNDETKRYGERLYHVTTFGAIYTKKCWKQTPEKIRKIIGKDFKIQLFLSAESYDTKKLAAEAPKGRSLADSINKNDNKNESVKS